MIQLEEHAALYAAGALTHSERVQFELILRFHDELRCFVTHLEEAAVGTAFAQPHECAAPCPTIKSRLLDKVDGRLAAKAGGRLRHLHSGGLGRLGERRIHGHVRYTLDELRGKKLGPILQGALTDKATAERMREGCS
jgi:hypothetical protein